MNFREPDIYINGKQLTISQCMTIRCAIESFSNDLKENGLGNDEHGRRMVKNYLYKISEIRDLIFFDKRDH